MDNEVLTLLCENEEGILDVIDIEYQSLLMKIQKMNDDAFESLIKLGFDLKLQKSIWMNEDGNNTSECCIKSV